MTASPVSSQGDSLLNNHTLEVVRLLRIRHLNDHIKQSWSSPGAVVDLARLFLGLSQKQALSKTSSHHNPRFYPNNSLGNHHVSTRRKPQHPITVQRAYLEKNGGIDKRLFIKPRQFNTIAATRRP